MCNNSTLYAMPIYLLRHGESTHNTAMKRFTAQHPDTARLEWWQIEDAFDPGRRDADLTDRGVQQAIAAQPAIAELGPSLVIMSPLARNLRTGYLACQPLLLSNATDVMITALLREHTYSSCDVGSSPGTLAEQWPQWADRFSGLPEMWWAHDASCTSDCDKSIYREPWQELQRRVTELAALLSAQAESHRCIIVIGHAVLFYALTGEWLANCELRELDLDKLRTPCLCDGFACRCDMQFDCQQHT